ncbi:YihY/virulence factor BrkB family protein [Sphingomonas ginkgonis]|uniref:YihY/virulence factor BrkB family protein n=1 Tax=Sphingomonas ginkgonis TaxID=2315330 RepID=A0A3R9Z7Y7_9SPHN|nr:YihY/virulence factor BrkB family protein [Sphingomonas ginkgonis]RST31966.1 YihY/virulence factor BrkB family protein [Sphingomonas ginkgonis]
MQTVSPQSPEARRKRLATLRARFGEEVVDRIRPGTRPFEVVKRVAIGVYSDGFIHAGNLAYLSLLAIFPFIIVAAALAHLLGRSEDAQLVAINLIARLPPDVGSLLKDPVEAVLSARHGPLLWFGGIVGLWTAASFVETIRDILRRAYGVTFCKPFWEYRLGSILLIIGAVLLMMTAFAAQVVLTGIHDLILHLFPFSEGAAHLIGFYRFAPAIPLYVTFYALFVSLTPARYRSIRCRKWPGALLVTLWWLLIAELLPRAIALAGGYSLTYGSLAGVMVALLFFFFIGLGVVMGAELNAALAETGGKALRGEVYSGPFSDKLEVEEPQPGEDVAKEEGGGVTA